MSYFPFFMEIKEKKCLVVGGGMVALRKIEKLLPFGGKSLWFLLCSVRKSRRWKESPVSAESLRKMISMVCCLSSVPRMMKR